MSPRNISLSSRDIDLLARIAYAEAGSLVNEQNGWKPAQAVADTVLNRMAHGGFGGNTVDGVLGAKSQFEPVTRHGGVDKLPAAPAEYRQAIQHHLENRSMDGAAGVIGQHHTQFLNPHISGRGAMGPNGWYHKMIDRMDFAGKPGVMHAHGALPGVKVPDYKISLGGDAGGSKETGPSAGAGGQSPDIAAMTKQASTLMPMGSQMAAFAKSLAQPQSSVPTPPTLPETTASPSVPVPPPPAEAAPVTAPEPQARSDNPMMGMPIPQAREDNPAMQRAPVPVPRPPEANQSAQGLANNTAPNIGLQQGNGVPTPPPPDATQILPGEPMDQQQLYPWEDAAQSPGDTEGVVPQDAAQGEAMVPYEDWNLFNG